MVNRMKYKDIENKHKDIIEIAKKYMCTITDYEHDINHMNDVVMYTKELLDLLDENINKEVCLICAYWHDVGRIKGNKGHERLSAEMLKKEMIKQNYDDNLVTSCYKAMENHKWNMSPETKEGLVIKDADKLAWLGIGRWNSCIKQKQDLNELMDLLPKLREEILYFEESKKLYDRDIVNLVKELYQFVYKNL